MKQLRMAALLAATSLVCACGGAVKVTYNLACTASCASTGAQSAIALTACELDGQDPTAIASANVTACVNSAKNAGCADPTCACVAERTANVCN